MKKKLLFLSIVLLCMPFLSCDDYMKRIYKDLTRIVEKYQEKPEVQF